MAPTPKIAHALQLADAAGIERRDSAPLLHRLLWRAGVDIAPPHFASFGFNVALFSGSFGPLLSLSLALWMAAKGKPMSLALIAEVALVAGLAFGAALATVVRRRARAARLPQWSALEASATR